MSIKKLKYKGYKNTKPDPVTTIKEYKYNKDGKLVKVKETNHDN